MPVLSLVWKRKKKVNHVPITVFQDTEKYPGSDWKPGKQKQIT